MDVDIAVYRDLFDTDPAITIKIRICADVLVHMIPIVVHRHVTLKIGWRAATDRRSRLSVDSGAKNL